jgi:hypothetical protein
MTPERAKILLAELTEELDILEAGYLSGIKNSLEHEIDIRENAYKMIKALSVVKTHFQSIADTKEIERKRWKIL